MNRSQAFSCFLLGAAALAWSMLSWRLFRDGVAARAVLLPVDPASYYAFQAWMIGPLLLVLSLVFALVAHRLARREGGASPAETWTSLTPIYAGSLLLFFLLPDGVAYALGGRQGMARAMRFYAPLAPLAIIWGAARRLSRLHGLTTGRAVLVALIALITQALIGIPLLR